MKCKNCNTNEAIKYSKYSTGEFCCRECARAYSTKNKRTEINESISLAFKGKGNGDVILKCGKCENTFVVEWKRRKQKYCSKSCAASFKMENGLGSILGKKSVSAQSNNRRSKNEIYFGELCKQKFQNVKFNEPMFNGWDADVIIEDLKLAVLWNGKWHYEKIKEKHSVEQVQNRDRIKQEEIIKSGYRFYIVTDLGRANKKFVEEKFKEFLVFLKLL